ncbi:MAG: hypothetical protein WC548_03800 [Candidatus Pacearchaeota archaeon]
MELNKSSRLYIFLKKVYEKTLGLWPLKMIFVKYIGFYNGKRRITLQTISRANEIIAKKLDSKKPFMLARFGSVEFRNLFSKKNFDTLCNNAGFFPHDITLMENFRKVYFEASRNIDILAAWNYLNHFRNKVKLMRNLTSLEYIIPLCVAGGGYYSWIEKLKNKKILVIHPFKKTIEKQMKKREKLGILPKVKSLEIIKSVQTQGGTKDDRFKNWFDALEYMKREIDKKKFDVALIGCGAYGLPLASYVKKKGKQAIHLGGGLQLLFGIRGKRWDNSSEIKYTKDWVSPMKEDVIENYKKVEGGCYW